MGADERNWHFQIQDVIEMMEQMNLSVNDRVLLRAVGALAYLQSDAGADASAPITMENIAGAWQSWVDYAE